MRVGLFSLFFVETKHDFPSGELRLTKWLLYGDFKAFPKRSLLMLMSKLLVRIGLSFWMVENLLPNPLAISIRFTVLAFCYGGERTFTMAMLIRLWGVRTVARPSTFSILIRGTASKDLPFKPCLSGVVTTPLGKPASLPFRAIPSLKPRRASLALFSTGKVLKIFSD